MNGKLYVTFLLSFKWNVQMHLKTLIGKHKTKNKMMKEYSHHLISHYGSICVSLVVFA